MYETPSRTKQEPFVGLILEQITAAPKGAELIEVVRRLPKNQKMS
jgi:inactivated superfamily I helicase